MAGEGKGVARGWRRWAKAVAARPYASAVLVGVLLCTPSLGAGLVADDYMHGLMLGTWTGMDGFEGSATDLFAFTRGGEGNAKLLDEGVLTWATTPGLKLAFWRPVSSLTHALDHALWPASPEAMHLHNLVWFALSIIAAGLLFARIQGRGWVMASALMLYATDDARAPAVGWIANRNALIAATFALLALVAHDRWRRDGWRPGALAGPVLLGLGLLSAEAAIGALAFVGAHALFLDRGPLRARALAVASWLVVVIVWRAVYDTLGYGAFGSGIYIDPGSDWLRFAGVTALHLPALLSSVFLGVWADIFSLATPSIRAAVAAAGAVAVIAFLLGVRAHVRTSARARFWLCAAVLAVIPSCATFPADRLLTLGSVAGMGFLTTILEGVVSGRVTAGRRWILVVVAAHAIGGPLAAPGRSLSMAFVGGLFDLADEGLPADPSVQGDTFVLVHSPGDPFVSYLPPTRAARGVPRPARIRTLCSTFRSVRVERVDARTLRIEPVGGYLESLTELMARNPDIPFEPGQVISIPGMDARVKSVMSDGRPRVVDFVFDRPLTDGRLRWFRWTGTSFAAWTPPSEGEIQQFEALDPWAIMGAALGLGQR